MIGHLHDAELFRLRPHSVVFEHHDIRIGTDVVACLNDRAYLTGRLKGTKGAPSLATSKACRHVCCPV